MVFGVLFALGLLTVAELWVIVQINDAIGPLATIGLMVLDAAIGSAIMRAQGRAAWRRLREALAAGRIPAREVLDGALVVIGGAFLITPGFITDVIGLVLLVPAGRALVRRTLVRRLAGRLYGGIHPESSRAERPTDIEGSESGSTGSTAQRRR